MKIIEEAIQGSESWHAHRANSRNASEAPAVIGVSKYVSRSDLLKQKATGFVQEVDANKERLFRRGHETEAMARVILEEDIQEDLYPVVALSDDGYLSASFDGVNMSETIGFEHKLYSADLAEAVRNKDLPPAYFWQLEQQLLVGGLEKIIFVCSDGTKENWEQMEYRAIPGRAESLLSAWRQFDADVANYQHVETVAPAVAAVVKDLPAVLVKVSGQVSVIDNFGLFEAALRDFIDNRLVRKPKNDQDFADLGEQIASLKKAEAALDAAEVQMLSQVESVDAMKRTKDMLHKLARDNRLVAEKLLAAEKENRKAEIVSAGVAGLFAHVDALSKRIGQPMPTMQGSFGGVIKGLKSLDSMRSNVADELARMKIETNATADRIEANKKTVEDMSLFPDFAAVCTKAPEDFAALLALRIAQRKSADDARLEAERAKIRAEEQAKAKREADAKAAADREAQRQADDAERARLFQEGLRMAAEAAPVEEQAIQTKSQMAPAGDRYQPVIQAKEKTEPVALPIPELVEDLIAGIIDDIKRMTSGEIKQMAHMRDRIFEHRKAAA